jgi:transposase
MKRFVEGEDRRQGVLLPGFLDEYVAEDNPVRAIDVFVDELDLHALGFAGIRRRRAALPIIPPKIYVYGYINQIQSNRRLERETARNVEMMWLTGRLAPDFKTIADFRKDNGPAKQAQAATGVRALTAIADRGYFKGEEIVACEAAGVTPFVPKPLTSGAQGAWPVRQAGLRL